MSQTILYVNNTDPQDGGGGDHRMFAEARELAAKGRDVRILASRTDPDQPPRRSIEGVQIRTVACLPAAVARFQAVYFYLSRSLFPFVSLPFLLWILWRADIDVAVDSHTPHPSLVAFFGWLVGTPVVALVHEYHDRTALRKYPLPVGLVQLAVQNLLRLGVYAAVVVPRAKTRTQLRAYGVEAPIHVVPNGIEFERYRTQPEEVSAEAFDLVLVSRLVHRKGVDQLLYAMREVVNERPATTLGIAGTGPKRNALERLAADLDLEANVKFLGYVSEARKVALLHEASVFVLPSRQEGFGIAVLEAMAAGRPVVVNDLAILRELVPKRGGKFADADNPATFASAIISVLTMDGTSRSKMGEVNQARAGDYSWEQIGDQVDELYFESGNIR